MGYTLSNTRLTQPVGIAEVDESLVSPGLIRGLFIPTMGYGANLAAGRDSRSPLLTNVGNMPAVPVKGGIGYRFSGTTNEYFNLGYADNVLDNTSCTILICEQRNSSAVHAYPSFGYQTNASERVIVHLPDQTNTIYFDYGNATSGSGRISISAAAYVAAGTVNYWAFVAGSRGREIWRNGIRLASLPNAKAIRSSSGLLQNFWFGAADSAGQGRSPDHTLLMGVLAAEQWSEKALETITRNPPQLFKPTERRIWATAVEGGGQVVVGSSIAGSWSVRGVASANLSGAWSARNASASAINGAWIVRNAVASAVDGAWTVRSSASATSVSAWSVRNAASESVSGAWSVRNEESASLAGSWSIEAAAGMAASSLSGTWSVRSTASSTLPGAWMARTSIASALSGAWSVEAPGAYTVATSISGAWRVAGFAGSTLGGAWSVGGTATGYLSGSWRVMGEYTPEPTTLYVSIADAKTYISISSQATYLSIARA